MGAEPIHIGQKIGIGNKKSDGQCEQTVTFASTFRHRVHLTLRDHRQ